MVLEEVARVRISALEEGQFVLLRGLARDPLSGLGWQFDARDCRGSVWIEDSAAYPVVRNAIRYPPVLVERSEDVTLVRIATDSPTPFFYTPGIDVLDGVVRLYESRFRGANGDGGFFFPARPGFPGLSARGRSSLFLSGCDGRGGDGASNTCYAYVEPNPDWGAGRVPGERITAGPRHGPRGANGTGRVDLVPAGDCNGNGVPDACDLASGTSVDLDRDGFPDECEPGARAPRAVGNRPGASGPPGPSPAGPPR